MLIRSGDSRSVGDAEGFLQREKKNRMNRGTEMTGCQIPSVSSVVIEKSRMKEKRPQAENLRGKGMEINQVFHIQDIGEGGDEM